jgi:hypothetical protein
MLFAHLLNMPLSGIMEEYGHYTLGESKIGSNAGKTDRA